MGLTWSEALIAGWWWLSWDPRHRTCPRDVRRVDVPCVYGRAKIWLRIEISPSLLGMFSTNAPHFKRCASRLAPVPQEWCPAATAAKPKRPLERVVSVHHELACSAAFLVCKNDTLKQALKAGVGVHPVFEKVVSCAHLRRIECQ